MIENKCNRFRKICSNLVDKVNEKIEALSNRNFNSKQHVLILKAKIDECVKKSLD